jgi:PhnB protein
MIMGQFIAYLGFDGNCADAMRFYERTLGGKLEALMKNSESPVADHLPPGTGDRIMHARLVFDGGVLMAGDTPAGVPYEGMKGFALTLNYPKVDEARRVFQALAEGGKITMPFQKTFWAEEFGMLIDRFGTPWIVNGGTLHV